MSELNNVIQGTDNDIGRVCLGKDISRARKKVYLINYNQNYNLKRTYKEDPLQFIHKISHIIGQINDRVALREDISSESEEKTLKLQIRAVLSVFYNS